MEKIKVLTFKGALKHLGISNATFYNHYRPFVKPVGIKGKALLYSLEELEKRQKEIFDEKKFTSKFEIIE